MKEEMMKKYSEYGLTEEQAIDVLIWVSISKSFTDNEIRFAKYLVEHIDNVKPIDEARI